MAYIGAVPPSGQVWGASGKGDSPQQTYEKLIKEVRTELNNIISYFCVGRPPNPGAAWSKLTTDVDTLHAIADSASTPPLVTIVFNHWFEGTPTKADPYQGAWHTLQDDVNKYGMTSSLNEIDQKAPCQDSPLNAAFVGMEYGMPKNPFTGNDNLDWRDGKYAIFDPNLWTEKS